jgi:GNAT superfamily N-acetyltransferase
MTEPHWYVWLLAVDPQRQGQGVGAALLRLLTTRAAVQNVPVYLWTVQPKSVPFYEHLGFQVVTHAIEPSSRLPFWTFRCNPKP